MESPQAASPIFRWGFPKPVSIGLSTLANLRRAHHCHQRLHLLRQRSPGGNRTGLNRELEHLSLLNPPLSLDIGAPVTAARGLMVFTVFTANSLRCWVRPSRRYSCRNCEPPGAALPVCCRPGCPPRAPCRDTRVRTRVSPAGKGRAPIRARFLDVYSG